MKKTVIAVIGCGRIANDSHFPVFEKMDNVRIKYACDLIKEKAEASKKNFPFIEAVITDYNVALADEEVEAVYVLTPNYSHYTITMDALRAGKHVFCEKPITVNAPKLPYSISGEDVDGKPIYEKVTSEFFRKLLCDIVRFFDEKTVSFDITQTLEVIRIRDELLQK